MSTDCKGMTLIELVMAIALAGMMVAGLMSAYSSIVGHSADPMVRMQATVLAESFLEEALQKPFLDPVTATRCPASPGGNRDSFDNVCDYNGYSASTISLPNGATLSGLQGYSVAIAVTDIGSGELGAISTHCALKNTVTITSPLNDSTTLTGYRTHYETACS